jgi:hypothetical protein
MHPTEVVLLDSLGLSRIGIAFHACPPMGVLRIYQPIFPSNDGAFPTIQLPLLGK